MKAKLYTDGGSRGNPGPAGIGFVIELASKDVIEGKKFIGRATNNQAEYEALLAGIKKAVKAGVMELDIYMDSELIIRQLIGRYRVKDRALKVLFDRVQEILAGFESVTFNHVPRTKNKEADRLVNEALDKRR